MRILVCGDRNFEDREHCYTTLDGLGEVQEVIEGGARGADKLAKSWAELHSIPVHEFPADWTKYGKAAGPIRNKQMLDEGKPDLVIAFLAPNSKGTKNMIEQAQKAGVDVRIINIGTSEEGRQP